MAVGIGLLGLVLFGVWSIGTPSAPPAWATVRPGMSRAQATNHLGPPPVGSFEQKRIEAWDVAGPLGYRRLTLRYDDAGIVNEVVESLYWSPSRRSKVLRLER